MKNIPHELLGRRSKTTIEARIWQFWQLRIENEVTFEFNCPLYNELRENPYYNV